MVESLLNFSHIFSLNANSPLREGRRYGIPKSFVDASVIIIILIIVIFISFTRWWRRFACSAWFLVVANFTFSYIILYRNNLIYIELLIKIAFHISNWIPQSMGGEGGVATAGTDAIHAHLCIGHGLCQHFLVYSTMVWNFWLALLVAVHVTC